MQKEDKKENEKLKNINLCFSYKRFVLSASILVLFCIFFSATSAKPSRPLRSKNPRINPYTL
jgi:hypothetical protein